jgi:hypothetical protein
VTFWNVAAGTYEVQVATTDPSGAVQTSDSTGAQNMFAIQAVGGGTPNVYGYDKMAVYNNLSANNVVQQFYIAQVDAQTGAGKTLTIDFFDIGDSTAGTIQILSPASGTPTAVPFTYHTFTYNASLTRLIDAASNCIPKAYSACSGNSVSNITVAGASGSSFNNTWIEVTIALPADYGTAHTLWLGGWWQVQYNVSAGSDLTTWMVNVNGNPVRLVPIAGL